ncbi:MAG: MaoC family dehydratase N-terminal domain-containing protein [Chloroflexi bacterium]|nr:MaoC family dehydratase N-terminal domain-containing protein [Chloroflexota bacterium]MCI0846259.1 MaoC family dehydratase N-terminal domain-containing protein [Chloroflexota bacterium]
MSTPTTFLTEEMRQQAIGLEGPPVTTEIEKGAIIRFAQAIEDDNPVFNDEEAARKSQYGGLIAPPTFLRSIRSSRREVPFDIPFNNALDGGSDWEYFEPVRPGDLITTVSRITDMQERSGRMGVMIITSTVTTYTNQFDQVVATQTTTGIRY